MVNPVHRSARESDIEAVRRAGSENRLATNLIEVARCGFQIRTLPFISDTLHNEGNVYRSSQSLPLWNPPREIAEEHDSSVIAEGIEDPADLEVLQEVGITLAQGFLFCSPARFDQTVSATRSGRRSGSLLRWRAAAANFMSTSALFLCGTGTLIDRELDAVFS